MDFELGRRLSLELRLAPAGCPVGHAQIRALSHADRLDVVGAGDVTGQTQQSYVVGVVVGLPEHVVKDLLLYGHHQNWIGASHVSVPDRLAVWVGVDVVLAQTNVL